MSIKNNTILGTFKGKCCDADAVNANGMFLSRDLFENLINSDEYKTAIENKYYIGFLGHPEDPNDMNFKNACVVMTSMEMESNGDIVGSFDLVDTPVGQIVKSFIDAGVNFGISIRGAGDVDKNGTVDPETFVFRGFDLVTFPAYEDCVPEFQEIAASTDIESQKKYKKVCNTIRKNISKVTSCETLDILEDHFNDNSDEYKLIEEQRQELEPVLAEPCEGIQVGQEVNSGPISIDLLFEKIVSLEKLLAYNIQEKHKYKELSNDLKSKLEDTHRKYQRLDEIVSDQNDITYNTIEDLKNRCSILNQQVEAASKENKKLSSINANLRDKNSKLFKTNKNLQHRNESLVSASSDLRNQIENIRNQNDRKNLLSDKKVEASRNQLSARDKEINRLTIELDKTVAENNQLKDKLSNFDSEVSSLRSQVEASETLIYEYQQAYADSCAFAAGAHLDNIPVNSSTTAEELKSYIYSAASNMNSSTSIQCNENEEPGLITI